MSSALQSKSLRIEKLGKIKTIKIKHFRNVFNLLGVFKWVSLASESKFPCVSGN